MGEKPEDDSLQELISDLQKIFRPADKIEYLPGGRMRRTWTAPPQTNEELIASLPKDIFKTPAIRAPVLNPGGLAWTKVNLTPAEKSRAMLERDGILPPRDTVPLLGTGRRSRLTQHRDTPDPEPRMMPPANLDQAVYGTSMLARETFKLSHAATKLADGMKTLGAAIGAGLASGLLSREERVAAYERKQRYMRRVGWRFHHDQTFPARACILRVGKRRVEFRRGRGGHWAANRPN